MALLGSVPAFNWAVILSTTAIPSSAGNPQQIVAATTQDISAMDFTNTAGGVVNVYIGTDAALQLICTVGGIASGLNHVPRAPIMIPKGSRISLRNNAAASLATGNFIINGWV